MRLDSAECGTELVPSQPRYPMHVPLLPWAELFDYAFAGLLAAPRGVVGGGKLPEVK